MEKMTEWQGWDKTIGSLYEDYKALSQKYERLIDEVKTINHGGKYVLKIVYRDGKEHVQKFNNIFDAISEIKFNNALGFRSYLKYDLSISIDLTKIYNGIKDITGE